MENVNKEHKSLEIKDLKSNFQKKRLELIKIIIFSFFVYMYKFIIINGIFHF